MPVLPPELWAALDASLGEIDLRLSPERAAIRITQLIAEQRPGEETEALYVSLAAFALTGALACRLRSESAQRRIIGYARTVPGMHPDDVTAKSP